MKRRRRIKMSLHTQPLEPIPDLTSRIAHASFPKGTLAMHLRDALGPIYEDADFADLFPKRGRAAEAPWRLALVTVLQALEICRTVKRRRWCEHDWIGNMPSPCRWMM